MGRRRCRQRKRLREFVDRMIKKLTERPDMDLDHRERLIGEVNRIQKSIQS